MLQFIYNCDKYRDKFQAIDFINVQTQHQNKDHMTALCLLSRIEPIAKNNSNVSMFELLMKYGANPNIPDFQGWLPIHYAASWSNISIMKHIFEQGIYTINQQTKNRFKKTPLTVAGSAAGLKYLLYESKDKDKVEILNYKTSISYPRKSTPLETIVDNHNNSQSFPLVFNKTMEQLEQQQKHHKQHLDDMLILLVL